MSSTARDRRMDDLRSILDNLAQPSTRARGHYLEKLTEDLCWRLKLTPVKWLIRGARPGGMEVLMLARDDRLPQNRWLLHCIGAEYVSMDAIATAVGRGFLESPHCLLTAALGSISSQAREFATTTSRGPRLPGLVIMLIDGEDLRSLAKNTTTVEGLIRRELNESAQNLPC